jgi:quinol monooxygenase YgiN
MAEVCILATVTVAPGSADAVRAIARDTAGKVTQSPQCVSYHIVADSSDPSTVCWFERWSDQDSLDQHLHSAEAAEFGAAMAAHIQGDMIIQTFEAIW